MSVQNAGAIIREARIKAGLSQEKMSEGICSPLSLSRIENNSASVSPSTFQALMAHAGVSCEAFPVFASRTDFDCFYTLKRVRFYLDCRQLQEAYEELDKIESWDFARNKFYYQEWLLLHCKLQFRSGCGCHSEIYHTLLDALHISRPEIIFSDFGDFLLSLCEIELLTAIAQEALYLNMPETCREICTQISAYLENSPLSFLEKDRLIAENAVVYAKYLITVQDYSATLKITENMRNIMIANNEYMPLHELTFLNGLGYYHTGNTEKAITAFKTAFFSAHSIGSCYATVIHDYIYDTLGFSLFDTDFSLEEIPLTSYIPKQAIDTADFSDGIYDLFSSDILTIGSLIHELRTEQNLAQQTLCYGLCSKSKLSKIENNILQPDVALAQTLLQRLGISDVVFTFYGSEREYQLQNLKEKLRSVPLSDKETTLIYANQMLELCEKKDIIYLQYAFYRKARCIDSPDKCCSALLDALAITIPDFNFNRLHNYRFSWIELTILHNFCEVYSLRFPSKGILYLYNILEYYAQASLDILEEKRLLPISLYLLISLLYQQKHFSEILTLDVFVSDISVKFFLRYAGATYSHYAQALGELKQTDLLYRYSNYSYYNFLMLNFYTHAASIKNVVARDFQIQLF